MNRCIKYTIFSLAILLWSCNLDTGIKNTTRTGMSAKGTIEEDSLIKIEVAVSTKKFRINDSMAIALIKHVPEIRQILDYKYKDSTFFNELHIENVPSDSDNNWHFQIVQFQPKSEHVSNILWLLVNADNGNINIKDIQNDTILTVDTWVRMRTRKRP